MSPARDVLDLYERLIATQPDLQRKGATMPYTSLNGHMFSFLTAEEHLALRLPLPERDAFLAKYQTVLCEQHGKVMKGVRRGARQSASRRRRASAALRSQLHLRQFAEAETH